LIWATFEHFGNTANAGYSYNAGNVQKSVPPDNPALSWLFAVANQPGTTSRLANSTMETFQQGPNNTTTNGSSNCFDCHNDSAAVANTDISHVFDALQPLPPFPPFPPSPPRR
jgi:hypothetical protein